MQRQDESDFTEESYYEEEVIEETPTMPPPARPAHPLFAGAAAKSAIAAAAANMNKNRSDDSDPRPTRTVAASPAPARAAPPPQAATKRPPHPLFGGGGTSSGGGRPAHPMLGGGSGGGSDKSALNDQIKAMAAKRNQRVAQDGVPAEKPKPKPKKSIDAVMPPGNKPAGANTASLAEMVAMRAAQRQERVSGSPPSSPPEANKASYSSAAPPRRLNPVPQPDNSEPAPTKIVTQTVKKGSKTTMTSTVEKRDEPSMVPSKTNVANRSPTNPTPQPVKSTAKSHTFQNAQLRSQKKTHQQEKAEAPASGGSFIQKQLKPTGVKLDLAPEEPEYTHQKAAEPAAAAPEAPKTIRRVTKEPVAAPPTQTIKRVTKSDPEYEIVEYKCLCTIM